MLNALLLEATSGLLAHTTRNNAPHPPHTVEDWFKIGLGVATIVMVIAVVKILADALQGTGHCPSCATGHTHALDKLPSEQRELVLSHLSAGSTDRPSLKAAFYCDGCGRVWDRRFDGIGGTRAEFARYTGARIRDEHDCNRFKCRNCDGLVWQEGWTKAMTQDQYVELMAVENPRYFCEDCGVEHTWQLDEASAMVFFDPVSEKPAT